ncbi:hypothetical protein BS47DRAFT_1300845, partial [Hydnum rufescens UP504]
NEHELELLIGGMPDTDVDDWTRFTDYREHEMNDEITRWSWQVIRNWFTECKSWLLQSATGTLRILVVGTSNKLPKNMPNSL